MTEGCSYQGIALAMRMSAQFGRAFRRCGAAELPFLSVQMKTHLLQRLKALSV
jgi:lipoate-protein ligase B